MRLFNNLLLRRPTELSLGFAIMVVAGLTVLTWSGCHHAAVPAPGEDASTIDAESYNDAVGRFQIVHNPFSDVLYTMLDTQSGDIWCLRTNGTWAKITSPIPSALDQLKKALNAPPSPAVYTIDTNNPFN